MNPGSPSVTACVRQVVKAARNGVAPKAVAACLGLEYGTFMAQLGRRSNHKLDADHLLPVMRITGSLAPLHLLARESGGFFVPMPADSQPGHVIRQQCMVSVSEFGALMQRVGDALADGSIDPAERQAILDRGYTAQTAILALLRLVEREARQGGKPREGHRHDRSDGIHDSQCAKLEGFQRDIDSLAEALREFVDAEQASYDERSPCWQESERGERVREALGRLEEAVDALSDASSTITDAQEVMRP